MSELTLDEVENNFALWRKNRGSLKDKIPESLWDQTFDLTKHYSTSKIITVLGLSGGQFSKQKKIRQSILGPQDKVDFVGVPFIPTPEKKEPPHTATTKIELKRPDGATVIIEQLPNDVLTQILQQFMRAI